MKSPGEVSPERQGRRWRFIALWAVVALAIAILVGTRPDRRTVTPEYRGAAERWLAAQPLYPESGIHGFLYLPMSSWLYLPLLPMPKWLGEPLWRWAGLALLAWSLAQAAKLWLPQSGTRTLLVLSLLVLPGSLASLQNGQTNLPLAATLVLAAVAAARRLPWQAAGWLGLAIVLKPAALTAGLLFSALLLGIGWRWALIFFGVLSLPFLGQNPSYVLAQYAAFADLLGRASAPTGNDYADFHGILKTLGFELGRGWELAVRMGGGLGLAATGWWMLHGTRGDRRIATASQAGLYLGFAAAFYLTFFNPRAEVNSYILIAPWFALVALLEWEGGRRLPSAMIAIAAIALSCDGWGREVLQWTGVWTKPLLGILVFFYFIQRNFFCNCLCQSVLLEGSVKSNARRN